jgi:hypothetical protein
MIVFWTILGVISYLTVGVVVAGVADALTDGPSQPFEGPDADICAITLISVIAWPILAIVLGVAIVSTLVQRLVRRKPWNGES